MPTRRLATVYALLLVAALLVAGCDAPPQKELSRAEGALQAAKAAGAETYATEEWSNAQAMLTRANDAVTQRDYRQALASALDAFELAQDAARRAAAGKAEARGRYEQTHAAAQSAIADAASRLNAPDLAKLRPARLAQPRKALAAAEGRMQEARSAAEREEFTSATALADSARTEAGKVADLVDAARAPTPRRPRD